MPLKLARWRSRLIYRTLSILAALVLSTSARATTVFMEDFNRADNPALGNNWNAVTVYGTGAGSNGQGAASILGNGLFITNDSSGATATTNLYRGRTYVYQDTAANFTAPYSDTLSTNPGLITWTFNMQQSEQSTVTIPTGFNYRTGGNYGAGFVLAASTSNFADSTGNTNFGYAVLWGNDSSLYSGAAPLRLVKFTNGIQGSTSFSSTDLALGGNFANGSFLSVKVTYDPATNNWALYGDSGTSFVDPTTVADQLGSTVADSTYTSTPLEFYGALYNYANGANGGLGNTATFDNLTVDVAEVPEPATLFLALFGGAALVGVVRNRRLAA